MPGNPVIQIDKLDSRRIKNLNKTKTNQNYIIKIYKLGKFFSHITDQTSKTPPAVNERAKDMNDQLT